MEYYGDQLKIWEIKFHSSKVNNFIGSAKIMFLKNYNIAS